MNLSNKDELVSYLKQNDLWAKRSMGQNFLVDEEVLAKIVEVADLKPSDIVVEVGPGLGVLTEELVKYAGRVVAIEKDNKLAELLNCHIAKLLKNQTNNSTIQQYNNLEIINADVLDIDLKAYNLQLTAYNYKLVANIPYNITSILIRKFLETENPPSEMILMVQKEVAERICASVGKMSLLSVSVQFYAEPEIVAVVKNTSFFPIPKVDSAIIKIKVKSEKLSVDSRLRGNDRQMNKDFFRLVKFGFASKRKTLENNLAAGLHISKKEASGIIKSVGLSEKVRAEELGVEEWKKLHNSINLKCKI